jgi:dihydrofolate reductase
LWGCDGPAGGFRRLNLFPAPVAGNDRFERAPVSPLLNVAPGTVGFERNTSFAQLRAEINDPPGAIAMEICLIRAQAANRALAENEARPSAADLQYFELVTRGHPVVMGRGTWESLPAALPGRQNIVLSSQKLALKGAAHCESLPEALTLVSVLKPAKVFVIGGASLFEKAVKIADRVYVRQVRKETTEADDSAPSDIDSRQFALTLRTARAEVDRAPLVFEEYKRVRLH